MKTKRLLSGVMSIVMIFTMFFAMTLVVNTAAPITASAEGTATATTKAIYVGPSTRYANNVPSGIFLPIPRTGKYGDGTKATITAKVKMLNGTKPFVQMMRTATSSKDGTVSASAGSVVFYQGDGVGSNWHDNSTSTVDSNGIFHCDINFKDIPGEGNCFYSSVWDGGTEYRKSNIDGRNQPIGCGVFIGNTVLNDDMSVYAAHNDLSMEFIISDIHITLTSVTGGDGTAQVGDDLAPAETMLNTDARYFFVGDSKQGNRSDSKNHPLNGRLDQWNICTPDEDTVRQITVADDIFDGGTHTYTAHAETDYEYEYYTCADFGTDVKFEKIGNCYSRYLDDDAAKKAFIIKSHAGDSKELTSNQGSSTVANIFIPMNIHKFYSAYNADTCGSADLREDSTAVRFGVSFKARRVSGTGQPVVGVAYADGNANGASGTSYKDAEFGAPREYGKDRSYNNALEKSGARSKQSDWVSSTYNASTGEFTALISTESGYYKQMSRDGKSVYISIGLAEHLNSSLEALNTDSTFVISDIKFTVYELNNSATVKFSGANQAPKMTKANCDTETPYQYGQLWDYNEKVNGLINVGVRHAPLNKYSVDGAVQNVFLINSNVCNRSGCTLTHHAATDNTLEYWSCATHGKNYDDQFASHELSSVSATKKMITVNATEGLSNDCRGAFITVDNDGWVGNKYFIFQCKMKILSGDGIPRISVLHSGYYGNGTAAASDRTSTDDKDGTRVLWTHYDPLTYTYTASIMLWRADPHNYNQFKYYEPTTGAHSVIMIGNFVPNSTGTYGSGAGLDEIPDTSFAFADPELYAADDAAAGTYTGDNLCAQITDKTNTFDTAYRYSACTQIGGAGEWADREEGTLITAPLGKWSRNYYDDNVYLSDIPANFFDNNCTHSSTSQVPAQAATCIAKGHNAYTLCNECGTKIGYVEYPVDPANHVGGTEVVNYRAATAKKAGYTGDTRCAGCHAVLAYGEAIPATGDYGTPKMFTISPNSSDGTSYANVFIPLDFTETAGTPLTGTCYFRLTFKAKLLADQLPIVGVARYQSWSPYGAQSEYNYANNNQKEHSDTVLMSSYDPSTLTFTAIIKLYLTNTHPDTGVHSFITIGNMEHNNTWYDEKNFQAYFAFTDPQLYAYDTTLSDTYGENLISPIASGTVCTDTAYQFGSNGYTGADSFVAAPADTWCIDTTASLISCTDIPAGYFNVVTVPEGTPKMLRLSGAKSTTNQQALNLETHLEAGKTYQFDLDYRAFGGVSPYINIQTAAEGGSYSSSLVTYTNTASNVDGAHRSVRFTMPANARSTNNFKTYLGQKWPLKNTGVVYFANASLREVSGGTLGENLFANGDFHIGGAGKISSLNASTALTGWGQNDILNYPSATLMPIPEGFFDGTDVSGDGTIALKATGGNYVELQFKAELKPNTYYLLTYDYRNIEKMPRLSVKAKGSVTSTKISDNSLGKYKMSYQLYSDENNTPYDGSGNDANTRMRLKFGASSSGKTLYINNVRLFELDGDGGNTVGANLVGNLNPILHGDYYSALEDTGDTVSVTLTQDGGTNSGRDLANGWFASTYDTAYAEAELIRVPDDFFDYLNYAGRITLLRKTVLGFKHSDGINLHYNPNNDELWGDITDLICAKKLAIDSLNVVENQVTVNGNPISEYRIFNDGADSSAVSAVETTISEFMDMDIQTVSSMPADGKVIRICADNAVRPDKGRVSVTGNTLTISAYRSEFIKYATEGFDTLFVGNSVNFANGYSREFSVSTEAYSSGSDKRIIGGSTEDSIGYSVGDTATVRLAAVSLNHAKILTGVSYFKIHMYNETTGATSDTYVTPANGVYEFNITSGSKAGFVFWYAIACDSGKNSISAFYEVDNVSGTIYHFAGSVGFGVDSISVTTAKPSDFNTYWQGVASGIGSTSGATVTPVDAQYGYNAYLVKIPCGTDINGNQGYATGYLTCPTNASSSNKIKLKVKFQSYGVSVPDKLYEANTAVFNVCAHSMDITSDSSINAYKSYQNSNGFNYTASTVEGTYFYQMIRRDLTAAKFMVDYFGSSGNNYWNGADFEAAGGSMGGFQSTAVAALLKYATANGEGISHLNIKIPYMCDLNGENNGRMPRYWGTRYTASLKYFDTTYFGSMVTCKTTIYAGLGDSICPASGTYSLYKAIAATDKMITYQQGATHSSEGTGAKFSRATGAQALALAA